MGKAVGTSDEYAHYAFRLLQPKTPMTQTFVILDDYRRQRALDAVRDAPIGHVVKIAEPTRNLEQNARLHALFSEAATACEWAGKKWSAEEWKVLLVSAHAVATGRQATVVPGLEEEFVTLRESTARMGKERMSSLIAYVEAWIAEHRIDISD